MAAEMTIQDFGAYLAAEQQTNLLQSVLRQLTQLTDPESVKQIQNAPAQYAPQSSWGGWAW